MKSLIIKVISLLCAGLIVCTAEIFLLRAEKKKLSGELDRLAVAGYNELCEAFSKLEASVYGALTEKNAKAFVSFCYTAVYSASDARDELDGICDNEEIKERGLAFLGRCREYFRSCAEKHLYSSELDAEEYSYISSIYAICKPSAEALRSMLPDVNAGGAAAVEKVFSVNRYISFANGDGGLSYCRVDELLLDISSERRNIVLQKTEEEPFVKPTRRQLHQALTDWCGSYSSYYRLLEERDDSLIYSSSSSCAIIGSLDALPRLISRAKVGGEAKFSREECEKAARLLIPRLRDGIFTLSLTRYFDGIYYFDYVSEDEEQKITVGIDTADGKASFIGTMG